MSLNPIGEVRYRVRLAMEHVGRAERLFELGDWVGVVSTAQLAVENFTKALIAVFEVPTWSHDPSTQLLRLLNRLPPGLVSDVEELARLAREMAPEYGRTAYGEPSRGLTPSDLYGKEHAHEALNKAVRARDITMRTLEILEVPI